MRFRTFTAESTVAAMKLVHDELGDEAIIIATRTELKGTTCITAAIDPTPPTTEDFEEHEPLVLADEIEATVRQALTYHGVPTWLSSRLAKATAAIDLPTTLQSFASALDRHFAFVDISDLWTTAPLIFVGPSGSGKTVTAAKFCTRERLAKRPVAVISADTKRAGGVEQLAAFTRILDIELVTAGDADTLRQAIAKLDQQGARILVDMPGTNYLDAHDMKHLATLVKAANGNVVLTLAAGGDPLEAIDSAKVYQEAGAEHLIVTRMDMARRYGTILAVAEGAGLALTNVSASAKVTDGLIDITPITLARLMMPHTAPPTPPSDIFEAAI